MMLGMGIPWVHQLGAAFSASVMCHVRTPGVPIETYGEETALAVDMDGLCTQSTDGPLSVPFCNPTFRNVWRT